MMENVCSFDCKCVQKGCPEVCRKGPPGAFGFTRPSLLDHFWGGRSVQIHTEVKQQSGPNVLRFVIFGAKMGHAKKLFFFDFFVNGPGRDSLIDISIFCQILGQKQSRRFTGVLKDTTFRTKIGHNVGSNSIYQKTLFDISTFL